MFRHLEIWALGLGVNPIEIIAGVIELDKFTEGGFEERGGEEKELGVYPNHSYRNGCTPRSH